MTCYLLLGYYNIHISFTSQCPILYSSLCVCVCVSEGIFLFEKKFESFDYPDNTFEIHLIKQILK